MFASCRLDQITVESVDRYRLGKVRAGKLSVTSINKTLITLAAILEAAVEYEMIDRNPARGRRRRVSRFEANGREDVGRSCMWRSWSKKEKFAFSPM